MQLHFKPLEAYGLVCRRGYGLALLLAFALLGWNVRAANVASSAAEFLTPAARAQIEAFLAAPWAWASAADRQVAERHAAGKELSASDLEQLQLLLKKAQAYDDLPLSNTRELLETILQQGGHSRQSGTVGNRLTAEWLEGYFRAKGLKHVNREALDAGLEAVNIPLPTVANGRIAIDLDQLETQEALGRNINPDKIKFIPSGWYHPPALETVVQKTCEPFQIEDQDGNKIRLNGLIGHTLFAPTCASGIQTRLQYLSGPDLEDLEGLQLAGRLCVVDLSKGFNRSFARTMGAVGFIYCVTGAPPTYDEIKILRMDERIPSALADPQDAPTLIAWAKAGKKVTFTGRMALESVPVWNIWGLVTPEGMDDSLQADVPTLVLTAFYDSYSLVPECSPGAQSAAGLVALLRSLDAVLELKAQGKLRNRVLFLASGGHFDRFGGMRAFAFRHARSATALFKTTTPALANRAFTDLRRQWARDWESKNRLRMDMVIALHLSTGSGQCGLFFTDANLGTGNFTRQPMSGKALGSRYQYLMEHFIERSSTLGKENVFLQRGLEAGYPMPKDFINSEGTERHQSFQQLGRPVAADGEILAFVGIPTVSIKTIQDYMPWWGTPWDSLATVDETALAIQVRATEQVVLAVAADGTALQRKWEKNTALKAPADPWEYPEWNGIGRAADLTQSVNGELVYWDFDKNPIVPSGRAGVRPLIPPRELEQFLYSWNQGERDRRIQTAEEEAEVLLLAELTIAKLAQQLSEMNQLNRAWERGAQVLDAIAILADRRSQHGWFRPDETNRDQAFEAFVQQRINQILAVDRRIQREREGVPLGYCRVALGVVFNWPTPYNNSEIIFTRPSIAPRVRMSAAGTEWIDQFFYHLHPVEQQLYNNAAILPFALDDAGNVSMGRSTQLQEDFPSVVQLLYEPLYAARVLVDYCRLLYVPGLLDPNTLSSRAIYAQRPEGLPRSEAALPFGNHGEIFGAPHRVCLPLRQPYEDPKTDRVTFISTSIKSVFSDASLQLENIKQSYIQTPPPPAAHEQDGEEFLTEHVGRGWDVDAPAAEYLQAAQAGAAALDQLGDSAALRFIPLAPYAAAADIWFRTDIMLRRFQTLKVGVADVLEKHELTRQLLMNGYRALTEYRYAAADRAFRTAHALEAKSLKRLINTQRGAMGGVVFYIFLILPFALFMERLLIGATSIYHKLAWFTLMAVICIWILAMVHPAFRATVSGAVSLTALVGILAFAIMAMALWIIIYLHSRFVHEMALLRRQTQGHFESDTKRSRAFGAGITIGLSNLRRRPLRTGLTVLVISLLTFSILSFTSVTSRLGVDARNLPLRAAYNGLLVHLEDWDSFEPAALLAIRQFWADDAAGASNQACIAERVYGKLWYGYPADQGGGDNAATLGETFINVIRTAGGRSVTVGGFMGLSPEEPYALSAFSDALTEFIVDDIHTQRWFSAADEKGVLISANLLAALGYSGADVAAGRAYVNFLGNAYQVLGSFDARKISAIRDLDGCSPLPLDFSQVGSDIIDYLARKKAQEHNEAMERKNQEKEEASPLALARRIDAEKLLIFPARTAQLIGGRTHSLAIVAPADDAATKKDFKAMALDFVGMRSFRCYLGMDGQATVLRGITATSMKRLGAMLIPLLVVGLIVLNTMMGAVAERMREIGTYSSVGLAPAHIGVLFLSESGVFATVGAVNGYLLGQLAAFLAARFDLLSGLQLNYSSTAAVTASSLVMLMVFLSTIWPARRASRMSVPDVTRSWNPPPPQGHTWNLEFPFTVAGYDVMGMVGYIARYFQDATEGVLTELFADEVQVRARRTGAGEPAYQLSFRVWLAPFDLGISQQVIMDFQPTGSFGVYEVKIALHLLSGDLSSWIRLNKRFLMLLRKRFLLWRVVPQNIKQMNIELTQLLTAQASGAEPRLSAMS